MIGCKPFGRHTEQHDIFFGIGHTPKDLIPQLTAFWPEAAIKMHIDAWRQVTLVDGFEIRITDKVASVPQHNTLFFINLGGYTKNVFNEQHYIVLSVKPDKATAIAQAKNTLFFEQTNFPGASSHIDDQYGVDVDDLYAIEDILSPAQKQQYSLQISPAAANHPLDEVYLGYFKLDRLP